MSMLRRNFNEQPNGEKAEHEHVWKAGSPLEGALGPCAKLETRGVSRVAAGFPQARMGTLESRQAVPTETAPNGPPLTQLGNC